MWIGAGLYSFISDFFCPFAEGWAVFSFLGLDKDGMGFMTACGCLSGRGCGLYFILLGLDICAENYLMPMDI